jgi:large subunit ribosomal protein L35
MSDAGDAELSGRLPQSHCTFRALRLQALVRTVRQGMPWPFFTLETTSSVDLEIKKKWSSKMPKMKTKSSAKKRFKITATGKVMAAAAGKRHGMIKRSNKFIRDARGTMVLAEPDGKKVIKNYLPNGL